MFIAFYVAEHMLHVSGILALVVYGLFLARNKGFCMDQVFCSLSLSLSRALYRSLALSLWLSDSF